jgi:RNA polymerase sigma-70 factor (ECF subfamily)
LSRSEIAAVLGVSEAAAGKRYLRALEKLKRVLSCAGGGHED